MARRLIARALRAAAVCATWKLCPGGCGSWIADTQNVCTACDTPR